MLKVFLVEDEIVVRTGIKNNIKWGEHNFVFVGEASDGEIAYPLIKKTQPDIIITDIKMPFMNGLELSKLIKKEMPSVKIIILSGHDEFEYAKEAIGIGVTDYLLKPVSASSLIKAIKEVAEIIYEEQAQKQFLETYIRDTQENIHLERQKFFEFLVSNNRPVAEILESGKKLNLDLSASTYNIILFKLFLPEVTENSYSEEMITLEGDIENFFNNNDYIIYFRRGLEGSALLLKTLTDGEMDSLQKQCIAALLDKVSNYKAVEYFISIGERVTRLQKISISFESASKAFAHRYLMNRNKIIYYSDTTENLNLPKDQKFSIKQIDTNNIDKKAVEYFLKSGAKSDTSSFIKDYFNSIGQGNMMSYLFRQYIVMDINFCVINFIKQLGYDSNEFIDKVGDIDALTNSLNEISETKSYLCRIIEEALEIRNDTVLKKYNDVIEKAKLFINENYNNPNMSLNLVAANINISPSHFSTVFSQETGHTFIEYLTSIRMDKAKELLRSSKKRLSEISFEIGYNDQHYFSYLFKKLNGCSPKDFRSGIVK